jgi:hypothetical protein
VVERGKYIGVRIDPRTGRPIQVEEAEHFYQCALCGAWVDCRDLGMVFDHEGPLPHPAGDKPQ